MPMTMVLMLMMVVRMLTLNERVILMMCIMVEEAFLPFFHVVLTADYLSFFLFSSSLLTCSVCLYVCLSAVRFFSFLVYLLVGGLIPSNASVLSIMLN